MTKEEFQPQSDPTQTPPKTGDTERGIQVEFISNATVIAWAAALLSLALLAVGVSFGLWAWLDSRTPNSSLAITEDPNPLDPNQRETRLKFEREQQERLNSYGWVEPERDIVHVPIERAMELLIERTKP